MSYTLIPMGATPETMVQQCCITIQYISESGERTEEPINCFTDAAGVARLMTQLAGFVASGDVARFTVEVKPSPYTARSF